MNGWQYYGTHDLQIVPMMPGTPVFRDGMLSYLYYKTREEGKIEAVFCGDDLTHDMFIEFFQKRKTLQVLCKVEENKELKPCGYSWVDSAIGVDGSRAALCGFCFFNDISKTRYARSLGMLGLAYWMIDMRIDVIHGISLESNIAAKNYAKHLGFREVALVPNRHFYKGELLGARVMMIDKNDFVPKFEQWFESQKVVV